MAGQQGDNPTAPGAPDLDALAQALVLADPEDARSLCVLREHFADMHPWPDESVAAEVEEVVRASVGVIDRLILGEVEDAEAALNELGRAASRLSEMALAAEASGPKGAAGAPAGLSDETTDIDPEDDAGEAAGEESAAAGAAPEGAAPDRRADQTDRRKAPFGRRKQDTAAARAALDEDGELLAEFIERSHEYLESADELLLGLQDDPEDKESIDAVFRAFHTIKGMAGFLALTDIQDASHDAENLLGDVRSGDVLLDEERLDALFAGVDEVRDLVDEASGAREAPAKPEEGEAPAPAPVEPKKLAAHGTVRVDEERLDRLVDTIGELVIAQASVSESARLTGRAHDAFAVQLAHLDKISRQLQEMATSMRMISLRPTMRRMARLVRDLAHDSGKQITCELIGDDIELDKSIVDGLNEPLLHLVRNAVDHGIETSGSERLTRGKSETATVTISARHMGGNIVIEVADDGRGLNREAILSKARQAGLIGEDDTPADEAIPSFLFRPGFSTAKEVTEISGRGVGMDAVKKAVDALRGTVSVSSEAGLGTTIRLTLPLTLAIIDGMVVRVADNRYILPSLSIIRTLCPEDSEFTVVMGKEEALTTSSGIVPLIRLRKLFQLEEEDGDRDRLVTLVSDGTDTTGLILSELLGQQQIVIKSLATGYGDVPGISGAAVLPDGRVGLILDIHGLVRLAQGTDTVLR